MVECTNTGIGGVLFNAWDRSASQTITDRGIAMIPPQMGPHSGPAEQKKKEGGGAHTVQAQCFITTWFSSFFGSVSFFFLVLTKMSWRSLLISQYSR